MDRTIDQKVNLEFCENHIRMIKIELAYTDFNLNNSRSLGTS